MIQQILSFLLEFWRFFAFWAVRDQEQLGFVRRLGRPQRTLNAGWNWKWPVIERAETEDARAYSYILDPQSLQSLDRKSLVVQMSVTCRVGNAKRYFLAVCDGRSNIQDVAAGTLAEVVQASEAEDVLSGAVLELVLERTRKAARAWGMRIDSVKWISATEAASYRLWQSTTTAAGQD